VNVIASFRNAGITARLSDEGVPIAMSDVAECRCLLHPFTVADLAGFDASLQPAPELDEAADSQDLASLPFCLQALEEEASQFQDWDDV
jgi:hypothetical protein